MSTKSDIEEATKSSLSKKLQKRLKDEFEKVINDPSEKKIKEYKEIEYGLLATWGSLLLSDVYSKVSDSINIGKANAIEQLKKKGYKKVENLEVIPSLRKDAKREIKTQIEKLIATIQSNSNKDIIEMRNAFILQKKSLTKGFMAEYKKYGVTFFTDRAGRKWDLDRYVDMLTTTQIASNERKAFFASSIEYGNDLVKVVHLEISPECEYCAPFTGKVLSITGKTQGYMSVDEASQTGHLFGFNCDHVTNALVLSPEKEEHDNEIELNDKNYKAMEKNGLDIEKIKNKSYVLTKE